MKKIYLLLFAFAIAFAACNDDDDPKSDPTISFITTADFTSEDVTLEEGDSIFVGINAEYNGDDNLTSFTITVNGQEIQNEAIDNLEIERTFSIKKSIATTEEWVFEVTDAGGRSASVSLTMTLEYGAIITNNSVILGAQNNSTLGSFYSTSEDQVYLQGEAFNNQELIDLIYYFSTEDGNAIGSPGANDVDELFTGTSGLSNWTTLNETRYYETDLEESEFDAVSNDSIFNIVYNSDDAKRKAKNLVAGDIYSFRTEAGKLGLFKVITVNGEAPGDIEIAVKVEE
jgi:hypothetical protein